MNDAKYMPSIILGFVAMLQLAAIKVPDGVDPLFFWMFSAAAAIAILGTAIACVYYRGFRIALGYLTVAVLLGFAIYIIATLPPMSHK